MTIKQEYEALKAAIKKFKDLGGYDELDYLCSNMHYDTVEKTLIWKAIEDLVQIVDSSKYGHCLFNHIALMNIKHFNY